MDSVNRSNSSPAEQVTTSVAARARLRQRADELKTVKDHTADEHLTSRPQRLRWSGRHRS